MLHFTHNVCQYEYSDDGSLKNTINLIIFLFPPVFTFSFETENAPMMYVSYVYICLNVLLLFFSCFFFNLNSENIVIHLNK